MNTDQNPMRPSGGNAGETNQQQGQPAPFQPLHDEKKAHNWGKIIAIVFGALALLAMALYSVVVSSLEDARTRAREAAARQSVVSILPSVFLCADNPENIVLPPRDAGLLCQGTDFSGTWPNIRQYGGSWGGCDFYVNRDVERVSIQYCAVLSDGTLFMCTENGCRSEM